MGRRPRHSTIDDNAFRELDRTFRTNACGDLLVRAFNSLGADDRAIMLAYITVGKNATALARLMHVSRKCVDRRLWRIQVITQERYERLKKETDE